MNALFQAEAKSNLALLGSLASVFAADGGQVRGPGSTTSDSIPAMLSDQEFVTRAAVVQQPGALDFLHAFNRHGMAAVQGWLPRVRHATGGLAGMNGIGTVVQNSGNQVVIQNSTILNVSLF